MRNHRKVVLLFALLFLSVLFLILSPSPLEAKDQPNFLGDQVCKECHEDLYELYKPTAHGKQGPGCEGCHGPGQGHVEGQGDTSKIFAFTAVSPVKGSQACLKCHRKQEKQNDYKRSTHGTQGLACYTCHAPHAPGKLVKLLRKDQPLLCYDCHKEVKAEFILPVRHRVPEGVVKCSDCHNPHTRLTRALLTSQNRERICAKCHRDKTGPFIYEHPASLFEGCMSCHVPHGSVNRHLLTQQDVRLLCLSCHSNSQNPANPRPLSPAFHTGALFTQTGAGFGRPCTDCHVAIHGSNSTLRFFR
ncbi:MAG: DmsE family decaheme c-type cytochrome [Candidatus Tectomicrobia bacterium]|uniref:DmsE family decaheme c-type cytochrome n=1 Tax=Tectimicrobiota bacterium TaxID=2528274 RepID=A0A933GJU2_UNCTE|nr:DmsE family decaheme c-type cytochrome [Candidatus Tectomicrobia bacterium]